MERVNRPSQAIVEGQTTSEPAKSEKSFDNLKAFVTEAMRAGHHLFVPVRKRKEDSWRKQWQILALYVQTDISHRDLGELYDCSREKIRRTVALATEALYSVVPPDVKKLHPYTGFSFSKPVTLEARIKLSHAKGGRLDTALEELAKGEKIMDISRNLGISHTIFRPGRQLREHVKGENLYKKHP